MGQAHTKGGGRGIQKAIWRGLEADCSPIVFKMAPPAGLQLSSVLISTYEAAFQTKFVPPQAAAPGTPCPFEKGAWT